MRVWRQFKELQYEKNSVVSIGTFDGVHRAHTKIIQTVVDIARKKNGRSVLVTFEPHPRKVLQKEPASIQLLTTLEERLAFFELLGVENVLIIDFNEEFSRLDYRDFFIKYIVNALGVSCIVEGEDHRWGNNREGTISALKMLGLENGFDLVCVHQIEISGHVVSSSTIRAFLLAGQIELVEKLLGRPYVLSGKVVAGNRRGRILGYPTANVNCSDVQKIIPKNGIYFVTITLNGKLYYGMASIGIRPTFETSGKRILEIYILDFNQDIYGWDITIEFHRWLRDEFKYDSVEQLIHQMDKDKEITRKLQMEYQQVA